MSLDVIFSGYFIYGFLGGIILAFAGGYLGVFLVLKRYSLLADALSHIALLGAAITFVLRAQSIWFNVLVVVLSSLLIEFVRKNGRFQSDSVIAVFITASLSIAVTVFSITKQGMSSIEGYLFGSLATVGLDDFVAICIVAGISVAIFAIFFKKFKLLLFDEDFAKVCGLKTEILNYFIIAVVAAFIAVSIKTVGVLTVSAVLVIPALTALSFRLTFLSTVLFSSAVATVGAIFGIFLSILFVLPVGTSVVLALSSFFVLGLLLNNR
jgi:zinc transport system permease protein